MTCVPTASLRAFAAVAVIIAVAGGCTSGGSAAPIPSTSVSPSPVSSSPSSASPSPKASSEAVTLNITVAGGKVTSKPAKIPVRLGQTVTINATSDEHDELHIHAIEKEIELQPGQKERITFVADQSGSLVVELHHAELVVATLIVR